ncbi:MAG: hypothetical protein JSS07_06040 [Proteobacteria bacterium]|nr:hypothetical protein [Pseudomonadota bacterium]
MSVEGVVSSTEFQEITDLLVVLKDEYSTERTKYVVKELVDAMQPDELVYEFIGEFARFALQCQFENHNVAIEKVGAGITEIFRRPELLARQLIAHFFEEENFPCPINELGAFFELCHNLREIETIKTKFSATPNEIIQILVPVYYEYVILGVDNGKNKEILQSSFLGQVGYAFIETLAKHATDNDIQNQKLAQDFRFLRTELKHGVMDDWIRKIDEAAERYKKLLAEQRNKPVASFEEKNKERILACYNKGLKEFAIQLQKAKDAQTPFFNVIAENCESMQKFFEAKTVEHKKLKLIIKATKKLPACKDSREIHDCQVIIKEKFKELLENLEHDKEKYKQLKKQIDNINPLIGPQDKKTTTPRAHSPFSRFPREKVPNDDKSNNNSNLSLRPGAIHSRRNSSNHETYDNFSVAVRRTSDPSALPDNHISGASFSHATNTITLSYNSQPKAPLLKDLTKGSNSSKQKEKDSDDDMVDVVQLEENSNDSSGDEKGRMRSDSQKKQKKRK